MTITLTLISGGKSDSEVRAGLTVFYTAGNPESGVSSISVICISHGSSPVSLNKAINIT